MFRTYVLGLLRVCFRIIACIQELLGNSAGRVYGKILCKGGRNERSYTEKDTHIVDKPSCKSLHRIEIDRVETD